MLRIKSAWMDENLPSGLIPNFAKDWQWRRKQDKRLSWDKYMQGLPKKYWEQAGQDYLKWKADQGPQKGQFQKQEQPPAVDQEPAQEEATLDDWDNNPLLQPWQYADTPGMEQYSPENLSDPYDYVKALRQSVNDTARNFNSQVIRPVNESIKSILGVLDKLLNVPNLKPSPQFWAAGDDMLYALQTLEGSAQQDTQVINQLGQKAQMLLSALENMNVQFPQEEVVNPFDTPPDEQFTTEQVTQGNDPEWNWLGKAIATPRIPAQ